MDYGFATSLHYWRSTSGHEVDFLVDEHIGIEVKATANPKSADLKSLHALGEEIPHLRPYLFCGVERAQVMNDVQVLPWREGLRRVWSKEL